MTAEDGTYRTFVAVPVATTVFAACPYSRSDGGWSKAIITAYRMSCPDAVPAGEIVETRPEYVVVRPGSVIATGWPTLSAATSASENWARTTTPVAARLMNAVAPG